MTLFIVETQEFGWNEIVIAAQVWGEWHNFVESVRQSLACLRRATIQTSQLPSEAKMRELANSFRYAHDLISADETDAWLRQWGMTVQEWMNCLRARWLRQRWAGQLSEIVQANPVSDEEVDRVIKGYAVCTGKLAHWARLLAGHAAFTANSSTILNEKSPRSLIATIEAEFEGKWRQTITKKLIAVEVEHHRLEWIHYDFRYLWFENESASREAACCMSEDGLTLEQVAVAAHCEVRQGSFYADEIALSIRPAFLAARRGDLLGPLKLRAGYPLFSLLSKRMPVVEDPQIVSRAEQAIIKKLTEQAMNERVQWVGRQPWAVIRCGQPDFHGTVDSSAHGL